MEPNPALFTVECNLTFHKRTLMLKYTKKILNAKVMGIKIALFVDPKNVDLPQ
jgi:hypothetical protein